jgi:enoyl-CoA hydratase/carnithine racemase
MISPKGFRYELGADGVAHITLNRPERLNSLTFAIYEELRDTFAALGHESSVRAVLISGEGRGFCSGGDQDDIIKELFSRDMSGLLAFTRVTGALIRNIRALRRPVVAQVHGACVGAGAVIALAADFRESAKFGFVFPRVGLCGADMGAAYLLPRVIGLGRASELLFLGDIIDAKRALDIGLVHSVHPEADLKAQASGLARRLASGPAFAHAMTKQMLEAEATMSLDQAIEAEAQAQAICMAHTDFKSAHEAWGKKTAPTFAGAIEPFLLTTPT